MTGRRRRGDIGLLRRGACHRARMRATRWRAMTLANIVARMERSEIRDSRDAGPGLRFAPSGLRSCCDLPVGRLVGTARSHILADFADTRARRKPLKPLRAGTSGDSGVLVVTRVRSTTTKCTRGCGCHVHPASPRPQWAEDLAKPRGASRGEIVNVYLDVIASEAKQSILSLRGEMDCFAALAMTARAMDCFAEPVIGRAFARPVGSQ